MIRYGLLFCVIASSIVIDAGKLEDLRADELINYKAILGLFERCKEVDVDEEFILEQKIELLVNKGKKIREKLKKAVRVPNVKFSLSKAVFGDMAKTETMDIGVLLDHGAELIRFRNKKLPSKNLTFESFDRENISVDDSNFKAVRLAELRAVENMINAQLNAIQEELGKYNVRLPGYR